MKILIVGAGITGTLLAWKLYKKQIDFELWADNKIIPASDVAAGLINPITGKRLAKIPNYEVFLHHSLQTYHEIENDFHAPLVYHHSIYRYLEDETYVHFQNKKDFPEFQSYFQIKKNLSFPFCKKSGDYLCITSAYRVNLAFMLKLIQNELIRNGLFFYQHFDKKTDTTMFKKIVLCRGYKEKEDSWFPELKWENALGEVLIFYSNELDLKDIYQAKKLTIIPLGNDYFWLGATYLRDMEPFDYQPSNELENFLRTELTVSCQIIRKQIGIRPILKGRFPIILQSPYEPKILMINGMGSKGTLLAPKFVDDFLQNYILI